MDPWDRHEKEKKMNAGTKVKRVTKRNYGKVCERAKELEAKIRASAKKKQFPSLHFMRDKWGFRLSDAALLRHRRNVLDELGIKKTPSPTLMVQRKKAKRAAKV